MGAYGCIYGTTTGCCSGSGGCGSSGGGIDCAISLGAIVVIGWVNTIAVGANGCTCDVSDGTGVVLELNGLPGLPKIQSFKFIENALTLLSFKCFLSVNNDNVFELSFSKL